MATMTMMMALRETMKVMTTMATMKLIRQKMTTTVTKPTKKTMKPSFSSYLLPVKKFDVRSSRLDRR